MNRWDGFTKKRGEETESWHNWKSAFIVHMFDLFPLKAKIKHDDVAYVATGFI